MARKGRKHGDASLTDEEWRSITAYFLSLYAIDTAHARLEARKLMRELDAEALEVFRVARRLERELLSVEDCPKKKHSGSAIIARLGNKFAKRYIDLAQLDLDERLRPISNTWYDQ